MSFPLGVLSCVTGVSGLGQVDARQRHPEQGGRAAAAPRDAAPPGAHRGIEGLDQLDKIVQVDQSPIGRTPRSNPATYTGVMDVIRDLYAKTPERRRARLQARPVLVQRQGRAL